jgi:ubiquinone/menaquinone biosynthesis C-methylase UbiE
MSPHINLLLRKLSLYTSEKSSEKAYNIWSSSYDLQPGNLMLDLDEMIFSDLLLNIDLRDKWVADIGCGTGRHWNKIFEKNPARVIGFDTSPGMLQQLKLKFPSADTHLTSDNLLKTLPDAFIDCLITTLTLAHIENIDEAIASWARVLKENGDLIITDFHPKSLANGAKRSFRHAGKTITVKNYTHSLEKVKNSFGNNGLFVVRQEERNVNEDVKSYYQNQNALAIYDRFFGIPIIYGLHLKKQRAAD